MQIKNYSVTNKGLWTGRVDDPTDVDSFRMHQVINLLDLDSIEADDAGLADVNVCFIGFCCDEGIVRNSGREGASHGPEYIRKEFANLPVTFGANIKLFDAGDIYCLNNNMEEAQLQLSIATEVLLAHNFFPIVLGGGHELALGHYNGISNFLSKKTESKPSLGIVNFDAHLDMRPYKNGGSSGTMFLQIADQCKLAQHEFGYLCFGAQTYANTISLFKKADELGAKYVLAKNVNEAEFCNVTSSLNNFIDNYEHLYITICSDVFNSAVAPGVSAMQPFGMDPEVILKFVKQVIASGKVVSFDMAEISPRFDHDNRTAKLAAIIIYAVINALVDKE